MRLLSITKLQNLKAIHNTSAALDYATQVVINHKTTKFESNSQLYREHLLLSLVVINHKLQNLKAIHNYVTRGMAYFLVVINHKLQNLKAIHNYVTRGMAYFLVVINHKTTKFESNSQLFLHKKVLICFII